MKLKFYSIKSIVALMLLAGIGSAASAQVLERTTEDINFGTYTQSGSVLKFTYTIYNDLAAPFSKVEILDIIPWGTTYIEGTTEVNGIPWADVNNMSPIIDPNWNGGTYLPLPNGTGILNPGETATLTYMVQVDANAGYIKHYYGQIRLNFNEEQSYLTGFPFVSIPIVDDISCSAAYLSHAASADANTPAGAPAANNIISSVNLSSGVRLTTVFNGATSINNYYANTNTRLPLTTKLLTDASAIAFDNATQRVYFVNNSVTTQQELYYINVAVSPARAYKFHQTNAYYFPVTPGPGKNITRMTWSPSGVGYALTDDASHLIKITIDASNTPVFEDLGALINDVSSAHPIQDETGGDLFADYFGRLYLVASSGNVFDIIIDEGAPIAIYNFTPTGLPTTGNQAVAIGPEGKIIVSGAYQDAWKFDFTTTTAISITGGSTTNVFSSGDYTSCFFPQYPWRKATNNKPAEKPTTQATVTEATVKVSPNPFINTINLKVALPAGETVRIRIVDLYGRPVYSKTEKLNSGINTLNLNIPGTLGRGIYVMDVWAGNKRLITKKLSHL
jgi:uncharacterized repeat protein (TIGR01451 family)